jgi:hypothetical protein
VIFSGRLIGWPVRGPVAVQDAGLLDHPREVRDLLVVDDRWLGRGRLSDRRQVAAGQDGEEAGCPYGSLSPSGDRTRKAGLLYIEDIEAVYIAAVRPNPFAHTMLTQSIFRELGIFHKHLILLAPRAGFEPATIRLTVGCESLSPLLMAFYALLEMPISIDFSAPLA